MKLWALENGLADDDLFISANVDEVNHFIFCIAWRCNFAYIEIVSILEREGALKEMYHSKGSFLLIFLNL